MDDTQRVEREIGEALSEVMRSNGEFANRWLVLAETVDGSGTRAMWTATSEGLTSWDSKGMLLDALDREAADTIRERLEER